MGDENINTANAPQLQNRVSGKHDTNDPLGTKNGTSSTRIIPGNDVDNGVVNRCTPMDDDQEDSAEDDDDEDEEEEDEKDSDEGVVSMVKVNSGISPGMHEKEDTQPDSAIIEDPIYSLDVSDKVLVETTSVESVTIVEARKGSTPVVNTTNGGEKALHDDSSEDEDEDDNMNERDAEDVKLTSGGSGKSENLTGSSGKQPVTTVTNTMAELAGESSEDEGEDEDENEDEDMQVTPVQSRAENDGDDAADDLNGEKVKDVEMKNTGTPDRMEDGVFEEGNQGEDKSPSGMKPNVSSAENHDMRPTSVDGKAVDMDMDKDTSKPNEGVGSKTSAKTDASGYFTSDSEDDDEPTRSATAKVKGTSHSTPVDSEANDSKDQGGQTRSSKESARGKGAPNESDGEMSGDEASHAMESSGDTRASVSASKIDSHKRRSKNTPTKASKCTRKTSTYESDSDVGDMANGAAVPAGSSSAEEGDKESVAVGAEEKAAQKKREFANDSAFNKGLEDGLFGGSSSEDEPLPSVQQARIKVDQNQLARDHQRMIRISGSLDMVANTAKGFGSLLERLRAKRENKQSNASVANDSQSLDRGVPEDGFRKPQPKHKSHLLSLFGKGGTSKSMSAVIETATTETLEVEAGEEIELLLMKAAKKKIPRARLQPKFSVPFNITSELVIASTGKEEAPTPEKKFDIGGKRRALKKHLLAMAAQSRNGMRNEDYMGDFRGDEEMPEAGEEESDLDYDGDEDGDSEEEVVENDGDGSATETEEVDEDEESSVNEDVGMAAKAKEPASTSEKQEQLYDEDGGMIEEMDMDLLASKAPVSKDAPTQTQGINTAQSVSHSNSGEEDMMGGFVDENGYFISQSQGPKDAFGGQQSTHKKPTHIAQNKFNRLPSGLFSQSLSMDMSGSSQSYSQGLKASQSQKSGTQTQTQALGSQLHLDEDGSQMNLSMAFGESGQFASAATAKSTAKGAESDKALDKNVDTDTQGTMPTVPKRTKRGGKTTQHDEPVLSQSQAPLGEEFQLGSDSQFGLSMAFGQSGEVRKDCGSVGDTQDGNHSNADKLSEELMLNTQNELNLSMAFGTTQNNDTIETPKLFDSVTMENPFNFNGQKNLSQKESGNTITYDEEEEDDMLERAAKGERMTFSHAPDTASKEEASKYFSDKSDDEEVQDDDDGKPMMIRKVIQGVKDQQKIKEREEKRKKRHDKLMDDEVGVSDEDDFSSDEEENDDGPDDLKDMMNDEDVEAGDVAALKRKIQEDLIADNDKAIDEIKQNVIGGYKRKAGNDFEDESEAMLAAARRRANARGFMDYDENSMDMFDTAHLRRSQIEEDDIELIDKSADFAKARVDKLAYMHSVESQNSSFSFHGCESMKSLETRRILQCIKKAKSCQGAPLRSRLSAEDSNSQFGIAKLHSKGSFLKKPANQDSNSNWGNGNSKTNGNKKVAASKSRKARFVFANSVSATVPAEASSAPTAESLMPTKGSAAIRKLHGLTKKKPGKPAPLKKAGSRGGSLFNIISNSSFKSR